MSARPCATSVEVRQKKEKMGITQTGEVLSERHDETAGIRTGECGRMRLHKVSGERNPRHVLQGIGLWQWIETDVAREAILT